MKNLEKKKMKTGYIKLGKLIRVDFEDEWKELDELKRPQQNRKRRIAAVR